MTLRTTSKQRWLAAAGATALIAAGAAFVVGRDDAQGASRAPSVLQGALPAVSTKDGALRTAAAAPLTAPPSTPEAAVDAFLTAETAGDFDASFVLLDAADRASFGSAAEWAAAHDQLPVYLGHGAIAPDTATVKGKRASVTVSLQMQPVVDVQAGIVPAVAEGDFVATQEDGGWRVSSSKSTYLGELPSDDLAGQAAGAWVTARQNCQTADSATDAYAGNLLGDPTIEAALCHAEGSYSVDSVGPIDDAPDVAPFLAAFGPDGVVSLRSVTFSGPGPDPLTVVVAPFGDTWVVIGVER